MSNQEYIEYTDNTIHELVYDKWELKKAYNYYNGKRDPEQFRYLEENFGIGNPTSVKFIPLIKKHIDALIGEYLGTPILPKVTCKDKDTVTKITREKELYITQQVFQFLQNRLKNKIIESFRTDTQANDPSIQSDLEDLIDDLNFDFQSEYEIAAQNVIEYLLQNRATDFKTKIRMLLLDLFVTGYTFFRAIPSPNGTNVQLEVLNPLNTFIDRNPNSPYVKDSYRVVIRKWLTKQEILNKYGKELSPKDRASIKDAWKYSHDYSTMYVRSYSNADGTPATEGIRAGQEIVPGYPEDVHYKYNLIPVYEVEWLDTDKDYTMQRYRTIRIGDDIYIIYGKDKNVIRSIDNPKQCSLSVNGLYFLNRDYEPYSLVLACADLQDTNDMLYFFRDNLIANSGTVGDFLDVSMLPKFLGENMTERLQKWIANKKAGIALLDTAQEGRLGVGQAPINTFFNGYDDTVKGEAIQAIQLAIEANEQTCSSITGVFRERLNGIQQRDAVTNVKVAVNNSYIISKQWNDQMDTVVVEMLTDSLNMAKIVYKKGLSGTLILGDKQSKLFTALPEYFTISDYDIHIVSSDEIVKALEQLKAITPDLISAGMVDAELAVDIATIRSLSLIKKRIHVAMRRQEKKTGQMQQLTQQLQQAQQQMQQMQSELQKAQQKIQQLDEAKMQLEKEKIAADAKIEMYKAKTDRTYKEGITRNDDRRTEIELMQLNDGNPYNDKVRQIGGH